MENNSTQEPIKQTVETKKSKTPAICSALCIVLALAGVGFGVYGMFFNKADKTATNDTSVNTPVETDPGKKENIKEAPTKAEITKVLKDKYGIEEFNNTGCGGTPALGLFSGRELDDKFKLSFIIQKYYHDVSAMEYKDCDSMCAYVDISYDEINEKNHLYFGNSNDIEKTDFKELRMMGLEEAKYIEESDSFRVKYLGGLGCAFVPAGRIVTVNSTEANEDTFTALVTATYMDAGQATGYGISNTSGCEGTIEGCPVSINPESIIVESSIYELEFIKEDGEYKLTGVTEK